MKIDKRKKTKSRWASMPARHLSILVLDAAKEYAAAKKNGTAVRQIDALLLALETEEVKKCKSRCK